MLFRYMWGLFLDRMRFTWVTTAMKFFQAAILLTDYVYKYNYYTIVVTWSLITDWKINFIPLLYNLIYFSSYNNLFQLHSETTINLISINTFLILNWHKSGFFLQDSSREVPSVLSKKLKFYRKLIICKVTAFWFGGWQRCYGV